MKPRPLTTDMTFCKPVDYDAIENLTTRQQCLSCARNSLRYDLSGFGLLSFFASPIIQPHKPCEYYLEDDRKDTKNER